MRLLRYRAADGPRLAVRVNGGVAPSPYRDLPAALADPHGLAQLADAARSGCVEALDERGLLAPVNRPSKLLFCGVNYVDHLEEVPGATLPREPFIFAKLPSAIVGPGAAIVRPETSTKLDYEAELAVVIGVGGRGIAIEDSLDHVLGYTVVNDISARDVQFTDAQITLGKGFDTFCPMGPELVLRDEIPDPGDLLVTARVNGELRQHASTSGLAASVPELIAYVSRHITLEAGDVIATGTPAGVGAFRDPPQFLGPGDTVTVAVDAIGSLTNHVTDSCSMRSTAI